MTCRMWSSDISVRGMCSPDAVTQSGAFIALPYLNSFPTILGLTLKSLQGPQKSGRRGLCTSVRTKNCCHPGPRTTPRCTDSWAGPWSDAPETAVRPPFSRSTRNIYPNPLSRCPRGARLQPEDENCDRLLCLSPKSARLAVNSPRWCTPY